MTIANGRLRELSSAGRFLTGLRPFLRRPLDVDEARRRLERQLALRDESLARLLQRAVFENPASPYRRLLEWAGVEPGDVAAMLREHGVTGTLERLHDAGVYVTLEEFKGYRPLQRPGLELSVRAEDFDNPLTARHYEARTGGSTGAARRLLVDLDLLEHESSYHALFLAAAGAARPARGHLAPRATGRRGRQDRADPREAGPTRREMVLANPPPRRRAQARCARRGPRA